MQAFGLLVFLIFVSLPPTATVLTVLGAGLLMGGAKLLAKILPEEAS